MSGEPLALRPHHGMCLAYFVGEGYSDGFSAHMAATLAALTAERPVRLTVGTDAICGACPNNLRGVCRDRALVEDYDRAVLARCGLSEGGTLPFGTFAGLVQNNILAAGLRRDICGGCQWDALCSAQRSRWEGL